VDQFPVLRAAVDAISEWVMSETSPGLELFLFTDNLVAESAFYRGTSSNPLLFNLIIHLKKLELQYSLNLHVVHIAGTWMMEQGTDGLSRGAVWECDHHPVSVVPLHLSPFDRDPMLLRWCASLIPAGYHLHVLSPQTWFTEGHGIGGVLSWWMGCGALFPPPPLLCLSVTPSLRPLTLPWRSFASPVRSVPISVTSSCARVCLLTRGENASSSLRTWCFI
jgi:hypothetical protein